MTREQLIQKLTDNHLIVSSEWVRTNAPADFEWLVEKMGHLKASNKQIEEFVAGNWWVQYGFGESGYNLVAAESKKALDQPNWGEGEYMLCSDDTLLVWVSELRRDLKYNAGRTIGAYLREIGQTQAWLGERMGLARSTVNQRLKQANWTLSSLVEAARAFGMTMEELGRLLDQDAKRA